MIETVAEFPNIRIVKHPLIQQKLTASRDKDTNNAQFRMLLNEIAALMVYELTSDFPIRERKIETPLEPSSGVELGTEITLVPILRAGLGMTEGVMQLIPQARIGHLGLFRDESSLQPVSYYDKMPTNVAESDVIVIDPMLATGGSLAAAVNALKERGVRRIKVLCLVSSPEGIKYMHEQHPEILVYTASVDRELDARGYILPGLGDAGDRLFGTE